ncbi:guanyl-nucleotide exchange factor, putative [Entamoeba dispar SAW760]|uniref:Guanyl-nucleotide exchange factor, putative n=1 Tax=Entamoeba dispar (strain ATCC PRA-260 / SAW760) TaxID=370354 RepID=B0E9P8_ENTDS|nr:guanyl-nucleotide exchange factor, putative [Entamoeba dispar SAW760]EDR28766.1 guanyl-nucleotide exchange factor, putative [Entamoeba dispar SAW760]|eukprot:EDR28766.1 guanyl-nucleotide exchange factor, putative [Entamoeba dispar SAW760]
MSQSHIFLIKSIQEICQCVQKKQSKLLELCGILKHQIKSNSYGDELMSGKQDLISPILEIIEESFNAKNLQMCCKAIDLIDKLLLYQAIKHVEITYKNQSVDILVVLINMLSSMFKYNGNITNLYVAKCLTTIVDKFSSTLNTPFIIEIFKIIYDMYIITPSLDTNNGAYQMCIGRLVDIILSKMGQKSKVNGELLKGNIQQGISLFTCLCQYATTNWSERTLNINAYNQFIQSITHEAKSQLNQKSRQSIFMLLQSYLEKYPESLISFEFITSKFVADLTDVILSNATEYTKQITLSTINLLKISIIRFRKFMRINLGLMFTKVINQILGSKVIERQRIVLELLKEVLKTDGFCIELFVNYDCDESSPNVFEDMTNGVVLALKVPSLSSLALDVLYIIYVTLVNSTEKWEENLHSLIKEEDSVIPLSSIDIVQLKEKKKIISDGLSLFEKSPKKGVEFFIEKELCTSSAESIVHFLHHLNGLNRKAFGEYLGGAGELNKECLTELLKMIDMKAIEIDDALRLMFDTFVMGGEGQVVERVIGAFSARYCECNPTGYGGITQDELYQLAMSIICLATETHNPSAKIKAFDTFEKFKDVVTSEKGFNIKMDDKPLKGIFERVVATPFAIVQKDDSSKKTFLLQDQGKYQTEKSHEVVREIHIFIYKNLCKEVMEYCFVNNDNQIMTKGVMILQSAVHLSSIFFLEEALEYLIQIMRSLACIDQPQFIEERHLMVIRGLLSIPHNDGEFLLVGWTPFLRCLFEIERLRQIASGWGEQPISVDQIQGPFSFPIEYEFGKRSQHETLHPSTVITEIEISEINEVFYESGSLGHRAAKAFFRSLCEIILEQIDQRSPGLFAFQALVVAASSNKQRSENHWAPFWDSLNSLFKKCCMHPNDIVSMGAIDCLRQLITMFGDMKEESCQNQERALEPFVRVIADHPKIPVKELVMECLKRLIGNVNWVNNIKSGWKVLIQCVRFAAEYEETKLNGFELLKYFYQYHKEELMKEYVLFVNSLIAYQKNGTGNGEEYNSSIIKIVSETLEDSFDIPLRTELIKRVNEEKEQETHLKPMYVEELTRSTEQYLLKYLPLYTSLAASGTGKYPSIAEYAITTMKNLLLKMPIELRDIIFYRSLYRCLNTDLPSNSPKVLNVLYDCCLELPLNLIIPVLYFAFNNMLNHEKVWDQTLNFLKKFILHEKFDEVYDQYLQIQSTYFDSVVNAIKGITSASITKTQRPKPGKRCECCKCHKDGITAFMLRCPGCLQMYYCEGCNENEHTLQCIRKWKSWKITELGLTSVSCKGLNQYITIIKGLKDDAKMLKQYEQQRKALFTAIEQLPLEIITEYYENIMTITFDSHITTVDQLHDLDIQYLIEEINKMIKYYNENGFTMCNSKQLIIHSLEQIMVLSDKHFLEIIKGVQSELVQLIASDDSDVRKCIIKIIQRIQTLVLIP